MSDSAQPHRQQPTRLPHPWNSPGKNTGKGCHFLLQCMKVKTEREVAQSCPTLSDPMDCSLPGSSIHGIFQARILEWGATAFSDDKPRQHIKKLRHYFANQGPSSQSYMVFPVVMYGCERRRQWQPTPVLLPGKSHGRRSLVGCSPCGH